MFRMESYKLFLALGGLLLIGLVADQIGRRAHIPRVTLLILFGFAAGASGFDVLPNAFRQWYDFLATVALTMVAFLLGGKLSLTTLKTNGKAILDRFGDGRRHNSARRRHGSTIDRHTLNRGIAAGRHCDGDGTSGHTGCREAGWSTGPLYGYFVGHRGN